MDSKVKKCQHGACRAPAQAYLNAKGIYVCGKDMAEHYYDDESTHLVTPKQINNLIKAIMILSKEMLVFSQRIDQVEYAEKYANLAHFVEDSVSHIAKKLEVFTRKGKLYKLPSLLQDAKNLKEQIVSDELYLKFCVPSHWEHITKISEGVADKSQELTVKELTEKYDYLVSITSAALRKQRDEKTKQTNQEIAKYKRQAQDISIRMEHKIKELTEEFSNKEELLKEKILNNKTSSESHNKTKEKSLSQEIDKCKITCEEKLLNQEIEFSQEMKRKEDLFKKKLNDREKSWKLKLDLQEQEILKERHEKTELVKKFSGRKSQSEIVEELENLHQKEQVKLQQENEDLEEQNLRKDTMIEELMREIRCNKEDLAAMNEDLSQAKKDLQIRVGRYTIKSFSKVCARINKEMEGPLSPKKIVFTQHTDKMCLTPSKEIHYKLFKEINMILPDLKVLELHKVPEECKDLVKGFLHFNFPDRVDRFVFKPTSECIPLDEYIKKILLVSPRVKKELVLHNFEISQDLLISLLSKNKKKKIIRLINCEIDLSKVVDFKDTLKGATIKCIDLEGCGRLCLGNWGSFPTRFKYLIKSLGECKDLKRSLLNLDLNECGLSDEDISTILDKYGFGSVKFASDYKAWNAHRTP
ncbi:unnamed protein product [Moneuplotes crassus]|uniref:Uncharacterized protein n=1 Tax=Euplotes crassus TaxID=5936 RepID=A0AAD2DAD0_EUPCR|nr:unnamed protein product [Moneuplotes crassus]